MAKDKIDLDDINFDDDSWDIDFDITPPKDDRSPVKKIASGAVKGLKSTLKDPKFIERKLFQTLPPGYSKVADMARDVGDELSELYNIAGKELEPIRKLGIKATKSALPKLKGKLPKKIEEKLQSILDNDAASKTSFGGNQDEANISLELGEIFKTQMEHQEQLNEKSEVAERTKTAINFKQHKESLTELYSLRQGIDKLVGYQDSINFKFQKKSLELQFKQYYAQRDLLELSKTTNKRVIESLEAITKNTALPEFVKVKTTETGKQMLKERMLKSLGGTAAEFAPNYVKNFSKNIKGRVKNELSALGMMASMGDVLDPEMMKEMGIDPAEMFGEAFLGSNAADFLSDSLIYKFKDKIPFMNKINKMGNKLSIFANEAPAKLDEFARSSTKGVGLKSDSIRLLKSLMPKFTMNTLLETDTLKGHDEATHFDNQTRKSIVEIIPGYLARILQSIDIMRTGDDKTELVSYDLTNNNFTKTSTLKRNLANRLFSKTNISAADSSTEYILEHLDPSGKLPEDLKSLLKSQILSDAQNNKRVSVDRYLDENNYGGFIDKASRKKLVNFFKKVNKNKDEDGVFDEELSSRALSLKHSSIGSRETAQLLLNAGYGNILEEMGVTNKMGFSTNLDFNKILEVYRNGTDSLNYGDGTVIVPNGKTIKKKSKKKATTALPYSAPQQNTYSDYRQSDSSPEIISFLDLFKTDLIDIFKESRKSDDDRNTKLDEIILRLDLQGSGLDAGPGTISFKQRAKNISKSVGGIFSRVYNKVKSLTKESFKLQGKIISSAFGLAKNTALGVKDALFNKAEDIYRKTDLKYPAIRIKLLQAGEYRDQITGKIITKLEDIKGNVVDKDGNIVLTLEDIKEGLVNHKGEKIRNFVSGALKSILSLGGNILSGSTNIVGSLAKMPGAILRRAVSFIDTKNTESDLIVPGELKPRLYLSKLKAGEYYDAVTGKLITNFDDIKNGVKDKLGNTLVTAEEVSKGLYGPDGKFKFNPFKLGSSLIGGAVGGAVKIGGAILKLNAKLIGGAGKLLGKGLSKLKGKVSKEDQQIILLSQIRDILDDRLADQTIDRAGSALDVLSKRKGRKGKDDKSKEPNKNGKKEKDGEGNLLDTMSDLSNVVGFLGRGVGGFVKILAKIPGLGKLGGLLASGGGMLLSGAASAVSAVSASVAAAGGIGAAAAGIGGTLLAGAGAAVGVIGSILASPVVIAGAIIGGIAYGGYKLFKYFKNKNAWLGKIRIAQYGVDITDSDKVSMVGDLEEYVSKKVKASANGYTIGLEKDDVEEILDIFDIDEDDKEKIQVFGTWFTQRFQPIYLKHVSTLDKFAKGASLMEADDKIALKNKLSYISSVEYPDTPGSPYSCSANPFAGDNSLPVGKDFPNKIIDQAKAYYKSEMEKEGIKDTGAGSGTVAAAGTAALAAKQDPSKTVKDKPLAGSTSGMKILSATAKMSMFTLMPGAAAMSLAGKLADFFFGKSNQLEAFAAVRLKTYGLKELNDEGQIKALLALESYITRKAKINKDGSVSVPLNETQVVSDFSSKFGFDDSDKDELENFFIWFKSRFMPACLKYYSTVRATVPNLTMEGVADKLKPSQKAAIAKEMISAKVSPDSNVSVWDITVSPFPDTEMNDDKSSTKEHIEYLESQTTDEEVKAQSKVVTKSTSGNSGEKTSILSNIGKSISNAANSAVNYGKNLLSKGAEVYNKAVDSASRGIEAGANAVGSIAKSVGISSSSSNDASYANLGTGNRDIDSSGGSVISRGKYTVKVPSGIGKGVPIGFRLVNDLMAELGLTLPQAAAVAGNLGHECMDFKVLQEMKPLIPGSKGGYGFCQWTGPRRRNFEEYCRKNNLSTDSYEANFGFLKYEITQTSEARGFSKVKTANTVEDATFNVMADFLRPSPAHAGYESRLKRARAYMKYFSGGKVDQAVQQAETSKKEKSEENKTEGVASTLPTSTSSSNASTSATGSNGVRQSSIDVTDSELANMGVGPDKSAKPTTGAPPAPPALLAKGGQDKPATATSSLFNINPFSNPGVPSSPTTPMVAASTSAVNKTIDAVSDKQNKQNTSNQEYQAAATDVQRKASSDYLNGGVDKMGGVLTDQLSVQKSIDDNIRMLVKILQNGGLAQTQQSKEEALVDNYKDQPTSDFRTSSSVQAPISVKRNNV